MGNILDQLDTWSSDNHLITVGIMLLAGAFILSFTCKTAWNEWKKRK